ncbi:Ankyrin repeat-containing domain protein [Metarhizium album ARSEF 1941]|uniref:Ankyrin repeat-containing domain protein n=1 Tax=Metarhizium album (strain ARSEF 1941) TaxID=1081103 RepID=A0A0B2WRP0_METAS|nr:Ankyrin repeat-containing domain protein [Metarhizium album ARSEF 1941]KHN96167.1 Ankyrin repeat-containing domain protein [Metarhizium album ARSEF 1941]
MSSMSSSMSSSRSSTSSDARREDLEEIVQKVEPRALLSLLRWQPFLAAVVLPNSISKRTREGLTILHLLLEPDEGDPLEAGSHRSLFRALLARSDHVNLWIRRAKKCKDNLLSHAISRRNEAAIMALLQDQRVYVNTKCPCLQGLCPLKYAVQEKQLGLARALLVRRDISLLINTCAEAQPLCAAMNSDEVWRRLLSYDATKLADYDAPLTQLANEHSEVVEFLLSPPRDGMDLGRISTNRTLLSFAAQYGHVKIFDLLASRSDFDADVKDDQGLTPLSYAAEQGHVEVVERLLSKAGVDVNSLDKAARTPLSYAAERGHGKVVERLLSAPGVIADLGQDNTKTTPLMHAVDKGHTQVVQHLLRSGASVSTRDIWHRSPLSFAADRGGIDVVELLLRHPGVEISSDDVFRAARRWQGKLFTRLLSAQRGNGSGEDQGLDSPKGDVTTENYSQILGFLLSWDPDDKEGSIEGRLASAASRGDVEFLECILSQPGVEEYVARYRNAALTRAVDAGHEEAVEFLLSRANAMATHRDSWGRSPLSHAVSAGNAKLVKQLADPDLYAGDQHDYFSKPLIQAAEMGRRDLVELLLAGSPAEAKQKALLAAIEDGSASVVELLLSQPDVVADPADAHSKSDVDSDSRDAESKFDVSSDSESSDSQSNDDTDSESSDSQSNDDTDSNGSNSRSNVDTDSDGSDSHIPTPLLLAVGRDDEEIVKLLLPRCSGNSKYEALVCAIKQRARVADLLIEDRDLDSKTLLLSAAHDCPQLFERLLREKRVDVNVRDPFGHTVLFEAVRKHHRDMVKFLLSQPGIDILGKDEFGRQPLWYARKPRIIQELLRHGPVEQMEATAADMLLNEDVYLAHDAIKLLHDVCRAGPIWQDPQFRKNVLLTAVRQTETPYVNMLLTQPDFDMKMREADSPGDTAPM